MHIIEADLRFVDLVDYSPEFVLCSLCLLGLDLEVSD